MFESARHSRPVPADEPAHGPLGTTVSRLVQLQGQLGNAGMGRLMGVAPLRVQRSITVRDLTGEYETAARMIEELIKLSTLHQLTVTYPDHFRIVVCGVPDEEHKGDFAETSIRTLRTGEVLYGTGVDNMAKVDPKLVAEQGLQLVITMNTVHQHRAGAALQVLAHEFGVHVEPFTPHLQHLLQGGTTAAMVPELVPWHSLSGGRQHADFALGRSAGYNTLRGRIVNALGAGGAQASEQALKAFYDQEEIDRQSQLTKTLLTVVLTGAAAGQGEVGISREELAALFVELTEAGADPQRLQVSPGERLRTGATSDLPPIPDNPPANPAQLTTMEPEVPLPGRLTQIPPEWKWGP